jgi:hypothetical protein
VIDDQAWTADGPDLAFTLTHVPPECLPETRALSVEIGRALFRSPALLGGPAARLGLSCNACHPNGHANAQFLLPELTDRPGSADVTAEWASAVRGDGTMNPVPIPDLTGVAARTSLGHKHVASLERFASLVIEEEFQGETPPKQAFAGVVAYLRALDPKACPAGAAQPLTLDMAADDVRRALEAAREADAATASLLVLAAQEALGRLAERLPAKSFGDARKSFEELARELGARRSQGLPVDAGWSARFDALVAALGPRESETYFNEATLRAALQD